jgi:hypothetical protein
MMPPPMMTTFACSGMTMVSTVLAVVVAVDANPLAGDVE